MPTDVTFVEVKNAFQAIAGLESLTAADEFFLTSSLNRAVHRAYNESDSWPRYLVVGEKREIYTYNISGITSGLAAEINQNYKLLGSNSGKNIAGNANIGKIGTNVYQGGSTTTTFIYKKANNAWVIATGISSFEVETDGTISLEAAGTSKFTETDTTKKDRIEDVVTWQENGNANGPPVILSQIVIPYSVANKGTIGEFLRVYRNKPFVHNSSMEYEFYVDSLGCNVINFRSSTDSSVFVNYKKELTAGFTPDSTNIPSEFVDYIIYTALSDFYTGDGQIEKASVAANQANLMLDVELLRLDKKANNNTINKKFSTYVNRQSR